MHLLFRASVAAFTVTAFASVTIVGQAAAQSFATEFESFSSSGAPIEIEADQLDVDDNEGLALYKGNVNLRQGEAHLKTAELRVFYDNKGGDGGQNIQRIVAAGQVVLRSGDRTVSGDTAVVEMNKDTVTLTGNVVLVEGPNVLRGERLTVDLKTKQAKVDGGRNRVQTILTPGAASKR